MIKQSEIVREAKHLIESGAVPPLVELLFETNQDEIANRCVNMRMMRCYLEGYYTAMSGNTISHTKDQ